MITPEELKNRMRESQFEKDMENALKIVNQKIEMALQEGDTKIVIPVNMELGNLYYDDEKRDALAERLVSMGYNCKNESNVIGGVRQHPLWYLYFV